jgi:carbon monoxide dehydrogenase subunit G
MLRSLKPFLLLALNTVTWLATGALGASAEPAWVKADASLTGVRISASMGVDADADTVWNTLTDYDRLTQFIPSMTVSRIVSKPGRPKRVEQRADSGVFSFVMPDHVVLAMEEAPPNQIRFRAVSGSVVAMSGEWRILGKNRPVRLVYRSHVVPMVPPPPLVSDSFIEDEVRKRFEAVGREAERRMKDQETQTPAPDAGYVTAPVNPAKPSPYMQEYVPNKYLPR